jgi:hypothetical protein
MGELVAVVATTLIGKSIHISKNISNARRVKAKRKKNVLRAYPSTSLVRSFCANKEFMLRESSTSKNSPKR